MTQDNWNSYIVMLENGIGTHAYNLLKKAKLGNFGGINTEILKLKMIIPYMSIMFEYDLVTSTDDDLNYFDKTEMKHISNYMNRILNKTYNPDFLLDN